MSVPVNIPELKDYQIPLLIKELKEFDPQIDKRVEYIEKNAKQSKAEALEYVVLNNPVLWAKVYLDWEARDYQEEILNQGKRGNKLVLRLGRRLGKCMPGYTKVVDPNTGRRVTIKEIYDAKKANVVTMNDRHKLESTQTSHVWDNGVKEVFRVKTNSGKRVDATSNHPLYTVDGWKEIDELKPGDYIATPRKLDCFGGISLPVKELNVLVDTSKSSESLSDIVFELNKESLKYFIISFFNKDIRFEAYDVTFARGLQHLLLRFGVHSVVEKFSSRIVLNMEKEVNLMIEEGSLDVEGINDICWEKIVSIESLGDMQTYDLTVPKTHNFVADDVIVHNTECMCILILWHAYTQINKGENANVYDILIIAPFETQVDLIFDRIKQLIDQSPIFKGEVARDIYHRIELVNGTKISGLTAGSKSGTGAAQTRGQRADLLVLDEVDYMGSSEITNILNIRNEAPQRIKVLTASTPSGRHEEFYRWATGASKSFRPPQSDVDNNEFTGYIERLKDGGNGWIEIYAPSIVNKELLKYNPDTEQTYLEDLKDELSEIRFVQEVMAEFGEEELGVYQNKYIEAAINEGMRTNHLYLDEMSFEIKRERMAKRRTGPRVLGVDWDKYSASTNMICVELNKEFIDEKGRVTPKFEVLFRIEIPRTKFTYTRAVDRIVELNDEYDFDWIAVDRGYGETQVELLHQYGVNNPETGLEEKVVGYQFGEKLEVRDPHTYKKDKKPMKPFMVNNSVIVFEKNKIVLNPKDREMIQQLEQYKVKSVSSNGLPTYSTENDHIVDALNLALLIIEQKYGNLMRTVVSSKIAQITGIARPDDTVPRDLDKEDSNIMTVINLGGPKGYIVNAIPGRANNRRPAQFSRRRF